MYASGYPTMNVPIEAVMERFIQAMRDQEGVRKLEAIRSLISREEFVTWTDVNGLDALHHAILLNYADGVDYLLKIGYFSAPYEPTLNLYAHLAARMGYVNTLRVIIKHRPDDFKRAKQPLFLPRLVIPIWQVMYTGGEINMPGIVGNATGECTGKDYTEKKMGGMVGGTPPGITIKPMGMPAVVTDNPPPQYLRPTTSSIENPLVPSPKGKAKGKGPLDPSDRLQSSQLKLIAPYSDGTELNQTPLEVAAYAFYPACVKLLLDMCIRPQFNELPPCTGYMTLCVLAECAPALKLLMKITGRGGSVLDESRRVSDFKDAMTVCMKSARFECLDLLLTETTVDVRNIFKPLNYYHVLYSWTAGKRYGSTVIQRLPMTTAVLIRRGFPVNSKYPSRMYPLYSLINASFIISEIDLCEFYITSMKALLEAGANPNFDEIAYEKHMLSKCGTAQIVHDRPAYCSAMDCLFQTVESAASQLTTPEAQAATSNYLVTMIDVVGKYSRNLDLCKVRRISGDQGKVVRGTDLHHFARFCVVLGVDTRVLCHLITNGADAGIKVDNKYPINSYIDFLLEKLQGPPNVSDAYYKRHKPEHLQMVDFLCAFMLPTDIVKAIKILYKTHPTHTNERARFFVGSFGLNMLYHSKTVRPLCELAAWRLWRLCGRQLSNLHRINVSEQKLGLLGVLLAEAEMTRMQYSFCEAHDDIDVRNVIQSWTSVLDLGKSGVNVKVMPSAPHGQGWASVLDLGKSDVNVRVTPSAPYGTSSLPSQPTSPAPVSPQHQSKTSQETEQWDMEKAPADADTVDTAETTLPVTNSEVDAERALSEKAVSEGTPSEKAVSEGAPSEKAVSEGAPSEKTLSEGAPSEKALSEGAPSEKTVSEGTPSEKTLSEGAPSEFSELISSEAVSERDTSEAASSEVGDMQADLRWEMSGSEEAMDTNLPNEDTLDAPPAE